MEQNEKWLQYAVLLNSQIAAMFKEDSDNYIDPNDFDDEENCTAFFHALCNVMPCRIWNTLTGEETDILGLNHNANRLAFQFCNTDKSAE